MTRQKTFKQGVRQRMRKTGESYTAARHQLLRRTDAASPRPAEPAPDGEAAGNGAQQTEYGVSEEALSSATGRGWQDWFAILDEWGAMAQSHTRIARWLVEVQGVAGWWAQSITVGYERARGLRAKHQQAGGFSIGVTRTIGASAAAVFDAFVETDKRAAWLPGIDLPLRASISPRSARFDWPADGSRLVLALVDKGERTQVALQHEKLPDAAAAEQAKRYWREALTRLKGTLEG